MLKRLLSLCSTKTLVAVALTPSQQTEQTLCSNHEITRNVIIETDFTADIDDLGALAIAHAMADKCYWRILAVMYNEDNSQCPPVIHAVNQWYGRDDIPIGIWGGPFDNVESSPWCAYVRTVQEDPSMNYGLDKYPGWFSSDLNDMFESTIAARNYGAQTPYTTEYSMDVYERVLAGAQPNSVTVVSLGYVEDLFTLLHFNDNLKDLWEAKVGNMYVMGGGYNFDSDNLHGFGADANNLYTDWTKPIVTSCEGGGDDYRTGLDQEMLDVINSGQYTDFDSVNPVKRGYFYHCGMGWASKYCRGGDSDNGQLLGRKSWDPFTMVLAAKDIGATGERQGISTAPNNGDLGCFPNGFTETYFYLASITDKTYMINYMQALIEKEPLVSSSTVAV
mmetsp:Transcript_7997/g.22057  ORF Transcript_7997/g.22057 Transcript_7997/m.22057 type:complete len:391 (-) Transcript_7997:216-1388(-)